MPGEDQVSWHPRSSRMLFISLPSCFGLSDRQTSYDTSQTLHVGRMKKVDEDSAFTLSISRSSTNSSDRMEFDAVRDGCLAERASSGFGDGTRAWAGVGWIGRDGARGYSQEPRNGFFRVTGDCHRFTLPLLLLLLTAITKKPSIVK